MRGKYPEPWRVPHSDKALLFMKGLTSDRDLYTDYWTSDTRDHARIWVGLRDNRDAAAHSQRIQALGEGLKKMRLPFKYGRGSVGPDHILLVDDLAKYVLKG